VSSVAGAGLNDPLMEWPDRTPAHVLDHHALGYRCDIEEAGGGWSGWVPLGGRITTNPAVARNHDGRLEAFARGTDNALHHIWQK
jgi:hypothetical protein